MKESINHKNIDLFVSELKVGTGEGAVYLREYNIGEAPKEGVISPGNMETGTVKEVEDLYGDEASRVDRVLENANSVPYAFLLKEGKKVYGDYTTPVGQDEFKDADLVLTKDAFCPPDWAKELWEFARLKKRKKFKTDNVVACLRSLEVRGGKAVFTLGPGLYSDSFYSNGIEGVKIQLDKEEKESLLSIYSPSDLEKLEGMTANLEAKYGKGHTIRDIIFKHYGHLPEFGEHVYNNSIGVNGMVLTRDGEYVFVKRGSNVSINQGINCTASGAAEFDEEMLSRFGMQHFLGKEMSRETDQELGLKVGALIIGSMKQRIELELSLGDGEYDLFPVGFIRELPRGGKPESMFLIKYKGNTEDLVKSVKENPHSEKKEIEGSVFSIPSEQVSTLLNKKGALSFVQHKGIVNLMLCNEYLKNNS
ncbi:MAG: hypothetical protein Q8N88_00185 [Nanoarchaeota archaeon]|nr:hypothetical protein [Nanoarchaeota archaeon]